MRMGHKRGFLTDSAPSHEEETLPIKGRAGYVALTIFIVMLVISNPTPKSRQADPSGV